jgi:hypothetical protein
MLYNRGMTWAIFGLILALAGSGYTIYSSMKPPSTPESMLAASKGDMAPINQEDEFHRQVADLTKDTPGGSTNPVATLPYGIIAAFAGVVFIGIGAYQMRMART